MREKWGNDSALMRIRDVHSQVKLDEHNHLKPPDVVCEEV
jgi:hypothetical protein